MPTLLTASQTTPASAQLGPGTIFETLKSYQNAMALKGAIDLDLFTEIGAGASTTAEIAAKCHASERGVRILCDFLTILGFLKKADGNYTLLPHSALFLDKASPAYAGEAAKFLTGPEMLEKFHDVASLVRKGSQLLDTGFEEQPNHRWVSFARSMSAMSKLSAQQVAFAVTQEGRREKVLDLAAGSGFFGISIARANPVAEIVAQDCAEVLEVARENAVRAGVQDRYRTIAGDAFEVYFGSGYDLILIPNFLHMFDALSNVRLLKKVRAALNPEGRVATVEFVPNEDRVTRRSPLRSASPCWGIPSEETPTRSASWIGCSGKPDSARAGSSPFRPHPKH